jgi:hypothetical protein
LETFTLTLSLHYYYYFLVVVLFEKSDSYRGFALAMPPNADPRASGFSCQFLRRNSRSR